MPAGGAMTRGPRILLRQIREALGGAGAGVFAFDRAKMLVGDPSATYQYFDLETVDANYGGMLPADLDGPLPPEGTPTISP